MINTHRSEPRQIEGEIDLEEEPEYVEDQIKLFKDDGIIKSDICPSVDTNDTFQLPPSVEPATAFGPQNKQEANPTLGQATPKPVEA